MSDKLTVLVLCPSEVVQQKFNQLSMLFSQANPNITMKSTNEE